MSVLFIYWTLAVMWSCKCMRQTEVLLFPHSLCLCWHFEAISFIVCKENRHQCQNVWETLLLEFNNSSRRKYISLWKLSGMPKQYRGLNLCFNELLNTRNKSIYNLLEYMLDALSLPTSHSTTSAMKERVQHVTVLKEINSCPRSCYFLGNFSELW